MKDPVYRAAILGRNLAAAGLILTLGLLHILHIRIRTLELRALREAAIEAPREAPHASASPYAPFARVAAGVNGQVLMYSNGAAIWATPR